MAFSSEININPIDGALSPGGNTPQSSSCTATNHPSRKPSKLDKPDMYDTAGELGMNS